MKNKKFKRMTQAQFERLVEESTELETKILKLTNYLPIARTTISSRKYDTLVIQLTVMHTYILVLNGRIEDEENEELNRLSNGKKPRKA